MRTLAILGLLLLLVGCTESTASRVDERTYKIEGPPCGSCGDGPNARVAQRICHDKGYYVVNSDTHKGGADRATDTTDPMTTWTIRCIQ